MNKGGVEFNKIESVNPPPASRHSHAATSIEDKLFVFFGIGPEGPLADFWQFDATTNSWSELTSATPFHPEPRSHHSAVALPNSESGDVFLFGGLNKDGQALADMFLFHTKFPRPIWSPLGKSPAGPRYGQSAVLLGNKVIIWGGHNGTRPLDDMWSADPESDQWTPVDQGINTPPARTLHASAKKDNSMWIFGGETESGDALTDTREFIFSEGLVPSGSGADAVTGRWVERAPLPAPLVNASAAPFTTADDQLKILVYGGRRDREIVADAFLYDVATNIWEVLELQGPGPRAGHSLVAIKNALFLFGGDDKREQ